MAASVLLIFIRFTLIQALGVTVFSGAFVLII